MSNVSHIHKVEKFESGKSKPLSGQRLAKVGYKSTEKNPAKYPSVCASVPIINEIDENQLDRLLPWIADQLMGVQDQIFKNLYESRNGKMENLEDADISIDQCIAWIENEMNGGRMTKESIEQWFGKNMEENLGIAIAQKLSLADTPEDNKKLEQVLNAYKGSLSALSGGATIYAEDKVRQLMRALEFVNEDDSSGIADKLKARLNGMLVPKKVEELIGL